jgi:hypothetical protein
MAPHSTSNPSYIRSTIGGFLVAGKRDEISGRRMPGSGTDQACPRQRIWRVGSCRLAGSRRTKKDWELKPFILKDD